MMINVLRTWTRSTKQSIFVKTSSSSLFNSLLKMVLFRSVETLEELSLRFVMKTFLWSRVFIHSSRWTIQWKSNEKKTKPNDSSENILTKNSVTIRSFFTWWPLKLNWKFLWSVRIEFFKSNNVTSLRSSAENVYFYFLGRTREKNGNWIYSLRRVCGFSSIKINAHNY